MNSHLALKISGFRVANPRSRWLLRAIYAVKLKNREHDLLRPELIGGSLVG